MSFPALFLGFDYNKEEKKIWIKNSFGFGKCLRSDCGHSMKVSKLWIFLSYIFVLLLIEWRPTVDGAQCNWSYSWIFSGKRGVFIQKVSTLNLTISSLLFQFFKKKISFLLPLPLKGIFFIVTLLIYLNKLHKRCLFLSISSINIQLERTKDMKVVCVSCMSVFVRVCANSFVASFRFLLISTSQTIIIDFFLFTFSINKL